MEKSKSKMEEKYENKFVDIWGYTPSMKMAIKLKYNIMLRGSTGTGKTMWIKELAKEQGKTLIILNMTAGATIEEIKGRYVVQPDEDGKTRVVWIDGALVMAMKKGYWIVIEEANFLPEELASVFYSVMDDRRNIIIDEHENEIVKAHPDFQLFLTGNWGYKGTTIPNDAIRNRIDTYFDLTYLDEKNESALLVRETGVDKEVADLICKFAWSQRRIKSRNQPDISTRTLIRWATLIKNGMSSIKAGEHTIISLLYHEEKEKEKIRETLMFEFEALEDKIKAKKGGKTKSKSKSEETEETEDEVKTIYKRKKAKSKSGDFEVGDLVQTDKHGKIYYGIIKRISTTRDGDKIWCLWNDNEGEAIAGKASPFIPYESKTKIELVSIVKKADEL